MLKYISQTKCMNSIWLSLLNVQSRFEAGQWDIYGLSEPTRAKRHVYIALTSTAQNHMVTCNHISQNCCRRCFWPWNSFKLPSSLNNKMNFQFHVSELGSNERFICSLWLMKCCRGRWNTCVCCPSAVIVSLWTFSCLKWLAAFCIKALAQHIIYASYLKSFFL